ncbi:methyl-accepting chemotaxis protein [Paraburkholderia tropica]|uniref:Methyl-accepting chemotaxis protein n=1 Tax=Paraburkholderia tropica TaxID=92647 RepID=A0AAQ1JTV9_9BURK|nr:methyl-accepting chemotaxis protein [Paraburkholderia tropica]RQN38760.1 methyl-accepting chemotaxis protein [Paraburkholderia tropica]SEJ59293.1 methyl-accepting chemotaxis protein [Paraburkholderia tropica]
MSFLSHLKIGPRLSAGFAVVLLLLGAVGGIGLLQASRIYDGTLALGDDWLPSVQTLGRLRSVADDVRRTSLRSLLAVDAADKDALRTQHAQFITDFAATLDAYSKLVSSAEERRCYDEINAAWTAYLDHDKQLQTLADAGDSGAADARALASGASAKSFATAQSLINDDIKLNQQGAEAEVARAKSAYAGAFAWTIGLIALAIALGIVIALVITRSITAPLARAVSVAETVARGDLTARIDVTGNDEASQLLSALRHMNERLVDLVARVRTGSEGIATAAAQIAAGNTDLSQRTEEQAASLEETAASMEELTATVKQNADNATQGNTLAGQASSTATRGGEVVGRVVDTMREISQSSEQVAQIISVIEGIAFQTNILALNAAVEAARAGEQGRGFAVVAGEVRTLAQRSATAAKEIKDLIATSVERVNNGTALVDDAGRTMSEIVQSVRRVADLMGEITAASGEQRTGIEQVSQAVSQMDEVTQQNAALVEEASAAAQSLSTQAGALRELVSVFKVSGAAASAVSMTSTTAVRATAAVAAPAVKPVSASPAAAKRRATSAPRAAASEPALRQPAPRAEPVAAAAAATSDDDWETF